MVATGRVQPNRVTGKDMMHVTLPPDPAAFANPPKDSVFVEFDVEDAQMAPGGRAGWAIVFGPNSIQGILAARHGTPLTAMPTATNIVLREAN